MPATLPDTAAGATAGFLATGPMTATMLLLHRASPDTERYPLEPRLLTDRTPFSDPPPPNDLPDAALRGPSLPAHFGFGAAAGSLYPVFRRALPRETHPAAAGAAFGLAVWTASYAGWIPAAGLLPPPQRQPVRRVAANIAAHLVYGACVGLLTERLAPRR